MLTPKECTYTVMQKKTTSFVHGKQQHRNKRKCEVFLSWDKMTFSN